MPKRERKKYYRNETFLKQIGLRIRQLRMEKGMTQEELAFECNYADFSQINRIELGKVSFSVSYLKLIADALEVPVTDLLTFED